MPNIGERLEEARKRQGISVREAAEATKVRSDFLLNYENNNFDFDLPEVYRRGFLKVYARYLKLDTEKIMTDYNAVMLGSSKLTKRENKEFFGRMDLPEQTKPIGGAQSEPPFGEHVAPKRAPGAAPMTGAPAELIETQSDASLYWKIGLIFVGGFIVVALVALLIQAIVGSDDQGSETVADDASVVADGNTDETAVDGVGTGEFKIIANDDVLSVLVRQDIDGEKLFSRSMQAGEEVVISRQGPVRVASSDIEKITIELNGEKYVPQGTGVGQIPLGMDGPEY